MYEPHLFIEEYFKLNWFDPVSGLVTSGSGIGSDMIFSNREINGNITETEKYSPTVYITENGKAAYQATTNTRRWSMTVNLYDEVTFEKLRLMVEYTRAGYYVIATILDGYQSYNPAIGLTPHVPGLAVINPGIIEFSEMAYRVMGRGKGTVRRTPIDITVHESVVLALPSTGGGGGGGGLGGGGGILVGTGTGGQGGI